MRPVLKDRPWGGHRLASMLAKRSPPGAKVGESWEVADHPHGTSAVADGPWAGRSLRWVLQHHDRRILGRPAGPGERFPVLVKFLDIEDRLSVQVHPDEATARARHPGETGKFECWVVVAAEPGAWIADGLRPGLGPEDLARAVRSGTVPEALAVRPATVGDVVLIPPGRVHSAGGGLLLAEVQQNTDVTYRLYDWDRKDPHGRPRPLHVAEGLEAVRRAAAAPADAAPTLVPATSPPSAPSALRTLFEGPPFRLRRGRLYHPWTGDTRGRWAVLVVLDGRGTLETKDAATALSPGTSVLLPAEVGPYALRPEGSLEFILVTPPREETEDAGPP